MSKVQLAIEIIRDHLGEPPWQAASLLVRGKRTLPMLLRESEMPYERLRRALIQLIQHNCLTVVRESQDPEKDTYALDVDAAVMRLRFPLLLKQAREVFGDDGVCIVSELLEKGRLTKGETLECLRRRFPGVEKDYSDTLAKMIAGHWVQRIPDLVLAQKAEKKDTSELLDSIGKGVRGPKRKTNAAVGSGPVAADGLELFLAAVAEEPGLPPAGENGEVGEPAEEEPEGEGTAAKKQKSNQAKPRPRLKKSKQPAQEQRLLIDPDPEEESLAVEDTAEKEGGTGTVLYRVNYCQFLLALRNAEIKKFVSLKYKDVPARIVQLMLETGQRLNERHTVTTLPKTTTPVARSFLCEKLDISMERIETHLTLLTRGHVISQHAMKRDKEYVVNIQHVMGVLRQQAVAAIIHCKFGQLGARVVRVLLDKKLVEDKQLQEIAMAPQKEVRQVVVDMYKSGYIQLQEVPRTNERKPAENFYLWGVDLPQLHAALLDVLYKTTRNLRARLGLERRRILDIPQSDPEYRQQRERLTLIEDRFNASIIDV
eukprot:EG_transcript_8900